MGLAFHDVRKVVLYVEDEPLNVLLMQALFEHRPALRLIFAGSGAQARDLCDAAVPSLLLLDIRLPDCRGDRLLATLRKRPGLADVPAVAVTADPGFDGQPAGFCEVWHKPLDPPLALRRLDRLLPLQGTPGLAAAGAAG